MTSCDAELAFLDELAGAVGIPIEEKKEEADTKTNEQQGMRTICAKTCVVYAVCWPCLPFRASRLAFTVFEHSC